MMTKEIYKKIRPKKNFLYLFFLESGGVRIGEGQFNILLGQWISMTKGMPPEIGMMQITNFFDKKFGYK